MVEVTSTAPPGARPTYVGLDIIRFAAAAWVLLFHLGYWSWANPKSTPGRIVGHIDPYLAIAPLASAGWAGVEVFFVLSGVVIASSAEGASAISFLRNRIVRLYPAAWICSLLSAAVLLVLGATDLGSLTVLWLRSVTLFPVGPWVDGVYWTLGVEMAFYGLIFVVLALDRFRNVGTVFIALSLLSAIYSVCRHLWPGFNLYRIGDLALLRHGCFFAIGGLLWLWSRRGATLLSVAAFCLALVAGCVEIYRVAADHQQYPHASWLWTPIVVWLASVGAMAAAMRWNSLLLRPGLQRFARQLGLATYPLYLIHSVVGASVMRLLSANPAIALAVTILASVGLSLFVSMLAEPWLQRSLRRLLAQVLAPLASRFPRFDRRTEALDRP